MATEEALGPDEESAWVARVRAELVGWYEAGHRELPWRQERDPYRILVSEMMLVQTTVAAVIPYYERFLAQFPTVQALAQAEESAVLKAWEGLGYYRRARQLHAAARLVVEQFGGIFPRDPEAVRSLPGVGRYIAGAVLSFAFDQPLPILEANTQRVLSRWLAWQDDIGTAASQARLWKAAERLVPPEGAGTFNQAFMELGASVCTPKDPSCLLCPVAADCRARALGLQDRLPIKRAREAPLAVSEACALVVRDSKILVVRRKPGGLWEGFWEFPTIHLSGADPAGRAFGEAVELAEGVRRLTGVDIKVGPLAQKVRFSVTKHRVDLSAYWALGEAGEPVPGPGLDAVRWEEPGGLEAYTFGSAGRRLANWVAQRGKAVRDAPFSR